MSENESEEITFTLRELRSLITLANAGYDHLPEEESKHHRGALEQLTWLYMNSDAERYVLKAQEEKGGEEK